MITLEMLRIYEKYGGNIDFFERVGKSNQESVTSRDLYLIDEILQRLLIVQSGFASADYEAQARAKAKDAAEDEQVFERLLQLSKPKT